MQMPTLQGTFDHTDFFIYTACDHGYFNDFAPAFINSIRTNTNHNIHIHIFNPSAEQIEYCQRQGVATTWEYAHQPLFLSAANRWNQQPQDEPECSQYDRTLNAMQKGQDRSVLERMQKTYYACARFVRLAEIFSTFPVLAVDIDAVVRKPFPELTSACDFYIHHISGKRARYLAGGLWLNPTDACKTFLNEYVTGLKSYFNRDYIYWGLDQDLLDPIVPKYNHGQLDMSYIDWNMQDQSYIWTAKGTRKELQKFVSEKQKYTS